MNELESGMSCVTRGSRVLMADESWVSIENVAVGDQILTLNESTSMIVPANVTKTFDQGIRDVFLMKNEDGELWITGDHKVYLSTRRYKGEWREFQSATNIHAEYFALMRPISFYGMQALLERKINHFDPTLKKAYVRVCDIQTTSGSFICEGFLIHNCSERKN